MQLPLTILSTEVQLYAPLVSGHAGNTIRGALGHSLRRMACKPECTDAKVCPVRSECLYAQLFEGEAAGAARGSGFGDIPRPFVLRVEQNDRRLQITLHLFGNDAHVRDGFAQALRSIADEGLGASRAAASVDAITTEDRLLSLAALNEAPTELRLDLISPTEIKSEGRVSKEFHFPAFFARVRDRVLFLAMHYAAQTAEPSSIAQQLAADVEQIEVTAQHLQHASAERRSSRTGQRHTLGGWVGSVELAGDFRRILPWLEAAQWTGVGRQTVWGKGQYRVSYLP
jgi:hypothetical protein